MGMDLEHLIHGDMPGDKIAIEPQHEEKAERIYPLLRGLLPEGKAVVCVCGGSGVGKSEVASLLGTRLQAEGIGAYVMSGDNYPHRIPSQNDAERERVYAEGGRAALEGYLGTPQEIDFDLVNRILADFKAGRSPVALKRMGRTEEEKWFDQVDFSQTQVLILEWTHGNSDYVSGVDVPILLNSTPEETLAHRRARARDKGVDSPFTTLVLEIEQEKLKRQAHKAKIIVSKSGEVISYDQYRELMGV
ncbi:MAG: adenylylsulfate kinase [Clostridia bacterium]|nr:adenylylsulfate kinase [Clostridia bacterium]